MASKQAELGPGECNSATGAKLIMVEIQWFNTLVRQGHIKAIGKNRYRVVDVVQGYITYLKDENRRATKSASASRVQDARANEIELKIAKERRDLIPADEVCDFLSESLGAFRSRLAGVPAAATRDPVARSAMETELDAAIDEIQRSFLDVGGNVRNRRPLVLETETTDA